MKLVKPLVGAAIGAGVYTAILYWGKSQFDSCASKLPPDSTVKYETCYPASTGLKIASFASIDVSGGSQPTLLPALILAGALIGWKLTK